MKTSEEALQRRIRSIAILKGENVPYIDHLPVIETTTEAKFRTSEEVANRAMALCIVAVKGEGLEQKIIDELVAKYKLAEALTPKEKAFIQNPSPTSQDRITFSWRYESYWVMLWALGYVEKLDRPDKLCNVSHAVSILQKLGADEFMKNAKLRSPAEILDAADLIYRYHWATEEARLKGKASPAHLESGVIMERHYALNWLIGYMDQDWDDVSTDT